VDPRRPEYPFVFSGWTSGGDGVEYDGSLYKGDIEITASGFPTDENKIIHRTLALILAGALILSACGGA